MSNIPQSKDDLTWQHHVVYYTFLPLVGVLALSIIVPPVVWYFGYISVDIGLTLPWIMVYIVIVYMHIFGDYVIPGETYRKLRSGEWDNTHGKEDSQVSEGPDTSDMDIGHVAKRVSKGMRRDD